MKIIAVIGGGASGMMAALSAAELDGRKVLLFERQARVGRKLLSTGNGRCNLTNTGASAENYHGEDAGFVRCAMSRTPPERVLEIFRQLGLLCTEEYGGRVYPLSDAAGSVLDVLRFALESRGVELHSAEPVLSVRKKGKRWLLETENGTQEADDVIVACGGRAGGKLGGVSDGYELLKSLGHSCTKLTPSLVPLRTDTDYPRSLKGVRVQAEVRLRQGSEVRAVSRGEVQFTEKGVSGPAIFDLSRIGAAEGGTLELDLLPGIGTEEAFTLLQRRRELSPEQENAGLLTGMLHSRVGLAVVKSAGLRPSELIGARSDAELRRTAEAAKHFCLTITGAESLDSAQVTAGGIRTKEFDAQTLESRLAPGIYACGEVLDIDGDCGGYNLQWAWASGLLAGRCGE